MDEPVFEDHWAESFEATDQPPEGPAFYFRLPLLNLNRDQTERVREQAEDALGHYADRRRAIVSQAFRAIIQLTTFSIDRRYRRGRQGNVWLVRVSADPTDPLDHIKDDRGTVLSWALRFSGDSDPAIGEVWAQVAKGFDLMFFAGKPDEPPTKVG
jgi:hypothetical protein